MPSSLPVVPVVVDLNDVTPPSLRLVDVNLNDIIIVIVNSFKVSNQHSPVVVAGLTVCYDLVDSVACL